MPTPDYIELGCFLKTYGLKGAMKVHLSDEIQLEPSDLDTIFLKEKGQYIPYFIESIEQSKAEFIFKIEDIESPEAAKFLTKQKIYIEASLRVAQSQDFKPPEQSLEGYMAFNNDGLIGTIDHLEEYPSQLMAVINREQGELLIPLNDQLITSINQKKSEIHFDLPEGFLDL